MQHVLSALALTTLLLPFQGHAALSTDAEKAVSFYRSSLSLFPSGQVSRTSLESKTTRAELDLSFQTSWDHKTFQLQGDQILRDIQVTKNAETKSSVQILSMNRRDAMPVAMLAAKTQVEILDTDSYWARVQVKDKKEQGWMPLHHLQALHDDTGIFINVIDTFLRTEPRLPSVVITTIPRLRRIEPLSFEKGFLKVKYEDHIGYADINHFVGKADFANLAYHTKKGWLPILHRNNDFAVTPKGSLLPLSEIKGYVTNGTRGIVVRAEKAYGPQLRSRVEITKTDACIWGVSNLDGHGEVWWKMKDLLLPETSLGKSSLTTDELMKREIYSIAFESKNSVKGVVSAEGVYRTEDGLTWTEIPQFGKQNYPVSIHPSGVWYVGSFRSTNKGASFEPFIRWDQIAEAIESAFHRNPKILRLTQIDALPNAQVQIHVDTGIKQVKLRSSLAGGTWNVVR
ncbi:hypothetical protein [Bdellovibrio sp. HCB2-146]|uniref:hypothetical protein n=1 Tax=Bdellovibrio sp. HCB2-146 TaxID=3394362 RepID=UPI0039BCA3A6